MDDENEGILQFDDNTIITKGLPQSIEFKDKHSTVSGCCSSNVTSTVSPLRLEPVNIHEQILLDTIRDQANKNRSKNNDKHSNNNQSRSRSRSKSKSDPPARTNSLSYPWQTQYPAMVVNNSNTEVPTTSEVDREDRKAEQQQQQPSDENQPVEISADDASVEVEVEVKTEDDEANAKLEAMQIMMEITKLEAEAEGKAKAAEAMIEKARQALKEAVEEGVLEANNSILTATTLDVVDGGSTTKYACCITESIERTIQDAEDQVAFEIEVDERAEESAVETSAIDEEKRDGTSLLDNDDDDDEDSTADEDCKEAEPTDPPVFQTYTEEEMPTVVDLVDPPTIIRRSAAPSPTPGRDPSTFSTPPKNKSSSSSREEEFTQKEETAKNIMAKYNKPKPDPTPTRTTASTAESDVQTTATTASTVEESEAQPIIRTDTSTPEEENPCTVEGTLESLYTKIEECRAKLMDPLASMDEQTAAAQLMTKYAKSAQALKKSIKESAVVS